MNLKNEIEDCEQEILVVGVMLHYRIIKDASGVENSNEYEELPPTTAAIPDAELANR